MAKSNIKWLGKMDIPLGELDNMRDSGDCLGMCRQEDMINVARLIVLDGCSENNTGSFHDVVWEQCTDIPVKYGRGIAISPDIPKPLITEGCILVCCRKIAIELMHYRAEMSHHKTIDQA